LVLVVGVVVVFDESAATVRSGEAAKPNDDEVFQIE
jgi:hypothetical protein